MRLFWQFVGCVVAAVALVLAMAMLLSGYWWESAGLGVVVLAGLALAAWPRRSKPLAEPTEWLVWDEELEDGLSDVERQMLRYGFVGDPVDVHQAQMARALNGPATRFGMARYDDSEPTFVWFPDSPNPLGGK